MAIACSPLDTGQVIDKHDRLMVDFRDTEYCAQVKDKITIMAQLDGERFSTIRLSSYSDMISDCG